MDQQVFSNLILVRRRQRLRFALHVAVRGLLCSAGIGIGLGIWRLLADGTISVAVAISVLAAGPLLGALLGLLWRRSWLAAATAIDSHCRLKDRTVTAFEFAGKPGVSAFHQLQVADAAAHLKNTEPSQVVPIRLPRSFPYATAAVAVSAALLIWPQTPHVEAGPLPALPAIVAVAEQIEEDLEELEKLAEQEQNEELKTLVEKLREEVEEMKEDGVDVREALATISEMQAAISAERAEYNEALVDAQLQSLGAAMSAAAALNSAGQKLEQGQFDKAAEELEDLADLELERREAKATAERMKKVAEAMSSSGLGQLSTSVSEIADGIQNGQSGKACKACRGLGKLVRGHSTRRRINRALMCKLDKLNECKSRCQACQGACKLCGGNCKGGQCQGNGNSLAEGLNPQKSLSPSTSWGKGTSGALFGEKTELTSTRNLQEITGEMGEGPSDIETSSSAEGREQARRSYREVYEKYRKLSEAVLDNEPIPLGHRQTIRRYFESIRPQKDDGTAADLTSGGE